MNLSRSLWSAETVDSILIELQKRQPNAQFNRIESRYNTNLIFRDERDGHCTVVKCYSSKRAANLEAWALTSLERIGSKGGDCWPRLVDSFRLSGLAGDYRVTRMSYLPGSDLDATSFCADRIVIERLGYLIARLHSVDVNIDEWLSIREPFSLFARAATFSWHDHLTARIERKGRVLVDSGAVSQSKIRDLLNDSLQILGDISPQMRLLHCDLTPSNIIMRADGGLALIDFERAACGDPIFDLVKLIWKSFAHDTSSIKHFLSAYGIRGHHESLINRYGFYERVYAIDMAAYLTEMGSSDIDEKDRRQLLDFLSNKKRIPTWAAGL